MFSSQKPQARGNTGRQVISKQSKGVQKRLHQHVRRSSRLQKQKQQHQYFEQITLPHPPRRSSQFIDVEDNTKKTSRKRKEREIPQEAEGERKRPRVNRKRPTEKKTSDAEFVGRNRSKRIVQQSKTELKPKKGEDLLKARSLSDKQPADIQDQEHSSILHWIKHSTWPQAYTIPTKSTKEAVAESNWLTLIARNTSEMNLPIPRKRSDSSIRRKKPGSEQNTPTEHTPPSEQNPPTEQTQRELKSFSYKDQRYETLLEAKGSFMKRAQKGITDTSKAMCKELLDAKQTVPTESLFQDDRFEKTCSKIQGRNEARVIRTISLLIVPSAEDLETCGATHLEHLIDSDNEGWTNCITLVGPRPQPDRCVGFRRSAFTENQLAKLDPWIGNIDYTSYFIATHQMYFPFLTCEIKCGMVALDIADRQNAHSMTIAVRAVVELFRLMKRENELHREILAFSISHDHSAVRIYGHYALIDGKQTTYYRHPIYDFSFTTLDGRERWTAYKFVKNIYDIWMPSHLKRISSAIDHLPEGVNFEISRQSELSFQDPPEAHIAEAESSKQSFDSNQPSLVGSIDITPTTSFTKDTNKTTERSFKKPKHTSKWKKP